MKRKQNTINRPFRSSKKSHFQSEAKCEAIDMKMIFNYDAIKTHFHNRRFRTYPRFESEIFWNSEMACYGKSSAYLKWYACNEYH